MADQSHERLVARSSLLACCVSAPVTWQVNALPNYSMRNELVANSLTIGAKERLVGGFDEVL